MRYEIAILIFFVFILAILTILPGVINFFLLRKLPQLPEIERKLQEGEYNAFDAARAQYLVDYCIARGIYFSKYEKKELINNVET